MEIHKKKGKVSEIVLRIFIAFIILVLIFELFGNDHLLVLDHLSLGNEILILNFVFTFSLVLFGLLTPITVVSLVNTMWKQRIPVDKRDYIRVGSLLMLFLSQYTISNHNGEEKEFIWKISKAVGLGSMVYIVLGNRRNIKSIQN